MKAYHLNPSKDEHGQPTGVLQQLFENNVSKAIDQLSGICAGILADGEVSETEAKFFVARVRHAASENPV